ncbi:MAG: NAD(P)-dependent oxidoreductase [Candidatus Neomarinimicrobiota bacterium]
MRAVIIGGAGFLGSHLIDLLLERNYSILCIDRDGCDSTYLDSIGIPIVFGDIMDRDSIEKHLQEDDIVFHLAALLGVARVSREQYFKVNVDGVVNVLEAAISKKARAFVFPSSTGAMGPVGSPEKPMDEDTAPRPDSVYGKTKLVAEEKIREIGADKITSIAFRAPPIFGPRSAPKASTTVLFNSMRKKTLIIVGDTENFFPLCYVKNLIAAMVTFTEQKQSGHHMYIIADGEPSRFNEILMMIRNEFGINKRIVHVPFWFAYPIAWTFDMLGKLLHFRPVLSRYVVLGMAKSLYFHDISKALNDGYQPVATLAEGIHETAEWMNSEQGQGADPQRAAEAVSRPAPR